MDWVWDGMHEKRCTESSNQPEDTRDLERKISQFGDIKVRLKISTENG